MRSTLRPNVDIQEVVSVAVDRRRDRETRLRVAGVDLSVVVENQREVDDPLNSRKSRYRSGRFVARPSTRSGSSLEIRSNTCIASGGKPAGSSAATALRRRSSYVSGAMRTSESMRISLATGTVSKTLFSPSRRVAPVVMP